MVQDPTNLKALERLEKKIRRWLLQGKTLEIIPDIRFIITQYRDLRLLEKADLMEMTLNQFISDSLPQESEPAGIEEPTSFVEAEPPKIMSRKEKKETIFFLHKG